MVGWTCANSKNCPGMLIDALIKLGCLWDSLIVVNGAVNISEISEKDTVWGLC